MHNPHKRLKLLHRVHSAMHLTYLGAIIIDYHVIHLVACGALFCLGSVLLVVEREVPEV